MKLDTLAKMIYLGVYLILWQNSSGKRTACKEWNERCEEWGVIPKGSA